ncbi:MAG TPA: glycosyltransferase [Caulobacteraceae bacterium]
MSRPGDVGERGGLAVELAIAAPSFFQPSETFIRDHARTIAPGATALICADDRDADRLGCPVLGGVPSHRQGRDPLTRAVRRSETLWREHVDAQLRPADRRRVAAFLTDHKVKVLLAEFVNVGVLFPAACRDAGVRLFVHAHGYDASRLPLEAGWARRYRSLFGQVAGIIAPSRFLADQLAQLGCPQDLLFVSPYGVDCDRFRPSVHAPLRVLAVGRLVDKKSPQSTIEAFASATEAMPGARLDIVGEGPLRELCQQTIARLGACDRVRLLGAQTSETVADRMSQASLFVQHSVTAADGDTEGLPVGILEAMASGVPVVSTRHSGIPEMVAEGETGLLVDEHDIGGMAAAIRVLLADPQRAKAMGAAGRERVQAHYTQQHAAQRLRAILGLDQPAARAAGDAPAALKSAER